MYVHIGNNEILSKNDIIAILDIKLIVDSRINLRLINLLKERSNPEDKSIVIAQMNNKEKIFFSNIAVSTLKKRINSNYCSFL